MSCQLSYRHSRIGVNPYGAIPKVAIADGIDKTPRETFSAIMTDKWLDNDLTRHAGRSRGLTHSAIPVRIVGLETEMPSDRAKLTTSS